MNKVVLLWVLPGSSKTFYAKEQKKSYLLDIDRLGKSYQGDKLVREIKRIQ